MFKRRRDRNPKKNKFQHRPKPPSRKEYNNLNQLQEVDVGITQFISSLEGFSGVIKARYSDFQVNEIDLNGDVAKLTDQKIPPEAKEDKALEPPEGTPSAHIPQDVWESIKKIPAEESTVELNVKELDKDQRKEIHECLQRYFRRKVAANTAHNAGNAVMTFRKFNAKQDENKREWPKDRGEYVHFLVYKECLDTLETTLKLASCLRIPPAMFAYAGVKDKRAKTTQWFSVKRVEPWKLIIKTKCLRNLRIGNITFKNQPLKLGDLSGNKFRIALRNVIGNDELIHQALTSIKEKGFINYFGLQRFGNNKEASTFSIGIQLLLGNWKEACKIILKSTESDHPESNVTKAKKIYSETGDATKAFGALDQSDSSCIEYLLLSGLTQENNNDFVNALTKIPRNSRLLYIHSFQSLVWNLAVSKRIEKYGLEVVEGDLVFVDDVDCEGRPQVKAVTQQDLENYSIYDIVLPLPGFDVVYPGHLQDFYKETLEKYGLTLEMAQQKVKEYNVSGSYRKVLCKVENLTWRVMHYNDPNYNLIMSDLDELKGTEEPEDAPGGAYKALVLEFSLSSASYATMLLREILKTDTSTSAHAKLNNYHVKEKREEVEEEANKMGLLGDAQKYEAFKNLVFGEENPLKRKHDEENEPCKMQKID